MLEAILLEAILRRVQPSWASIAAAATASDQKVQGPGEPGTRLRRDRPTWPAAARPDMLEQSRATQDSGGSRTGQAYTVEELLEIRWIGWMELGAPAWSGTSPVCAACATERVAQMDASLQRREPGA